MKTSVIPEDGEVWFVTLRGFFGSSRPSHTLCTSCYEGLDLEKKPAFRSRVKKGRSRGLHRMQGGRDLNFLSKVNALRKVLTTPTSTQKILMERMGSLAASIESCKKNLEKSHKQLHRRFERGEHLLVSELQAITVATAELGQLHRLYQADSDHIMVSMTQEQRAEVYLCL